MSVNLFGGVGGWVLFPPFSGLFISLIVCGFGPALFGVASATSLAAGVRLFTVLPAGLIFVIEGEVNTLIIRHERLRALISPRASARFPCLRYSFVSSPITHPP